MYFTPSCMSFPSLFKPDFCLLIVGVEGYCCIWSHSITHIHAVGFPSTSHRPVPETSTLQHITFTRDRHPFLGGNRSCNPRKRAAADQRLRPCGHRNRPVYLYE
jgi:hypothetical protein